ncbi:MAG: phage shock protein operon transcriptional activator [Proteobacteria bacterium]|nr:phage shock protein operon transcriptional activator [Pseudomonadota bacterium]
MESDAASVRIQEALGQSEAFLTFQEQLSRAAKVDRPLLIVGERGTGKELAAARVHYLSGRWREPLVTLNCAALAPTLIETELFGAEAGAYTGAVRRRMGRFEAAAGGTLFLDEIGNVPLEVQEKILRVVEYQTFERVGGSVSLEADVRIVGATNADLPALAAQGRFKQDLLDRLSFEVLVVPPLRQREDDVLFLANHFAARMARELGLESVPVFSDAAAEAIERHGWPGNIRELKNVVERAVYRCGAGRIEAIVFDPFPAGTGRRETEPEEASPTGGGGPEPVEPVRLDVPLTEQVRRLEVRLIKEALVRAQYNQGEAARILGLTYNQFRGLYRKYRARGL